MMWLFDPTKRCSCVCKKSFYELKKLRERGVPLKNPRQQNKKLADFIIFHLVPGHSPELIKSITTLQQDYSSFRHLHHSIL